MVGVGLAKNSVFASNVESFLEGPHRNICGAARLGLLRRRGQTLEEGNGVGERFVVEAEGAQGRKL
jgi:hypothetical protein